MKYKILSRYYVELDQEIEAESEDKAIEIAQNIAESTDLRDWDRTIYYDSIVVKE